MLLLHAGGPLWPRFDHNAPNGWGVRHYPDFVREAFLEGAEYTEDGKCWPKPTEVLLSPGDAVVALYHVPHNATRNEGSTATPRYQLYFRVTNGSRAAYKEFDHSTEDTLLDPWKDWEGLRADLPRLRQEFGATSADQASSRSARL